MALPRPARPDANGRIQCDVAIVGAGVAGLSAALHLPEHLDVVVIDKGTGARSGSSPWAQGGLAAAIHPDDSPALHTRDTLLAGDGLSDPAAAEVLSRETPGRVADLLRLGAHLDDDDGGPAATLDDLHLAREGAQAVARSVHRADATGAELVRVLREHVTDRVSRLAGMVISLSVDPAGTCTGCWVLSDGDLVGVEAGAVLLASGGCGGLFAATTNQDTATADGVALAYAAGAAVRDLEFVQFHPTGMAVEGSWRFLLTEALRGAGATLHDADGARFMVGLHPDAELAPRHVVASAILAQDGGTAWLDATALGEDLLAHEFPTVLAGAREHGWDLATQRVPVTPAAHYMVGGVRTDLHARTSLDGLFAAGEVASTGLHGANRMAGNSLSEALVFGPRAADAIARRLAARPADDTRPGLTSPPSLRACGLDGTALAEIRAALRSTMWVGTGPVRSAASLAATAQDLAELGGALGPATDDAVHAELRLAVGASSLITAAAMLRNESRGGHHRTDFPERHPAFADVHLERVRPRD